VPSSSSQSSTCAEATSSSRGPNLVPLTSAASFGTASGGAEEPDQDTLERVLAGGMVVAGAAPPASPERELALRELRSALQAALADMPEPERIVIVMAYADDLSQSEIAEQLGWPLGTVKTRTRRALRHLREVLGSGVGPEYTRYMAPAEMAGPDH